MIRQVTIDTTENGYTVTQENEKLGHVNFSFESFDALTGHLCRTLGARILLKHDRLLPYSVIDKCEDKSPEAMRDEIGELRRFKERAIKRDEELRKKVDDAIAISADYKSQRDRAWLATSAAQQELNHARAKLTKHSKRKVRK